MSAPAFPAGRSVRLPERPGQRGLSLAVHEQGSGPAVVLCHGFPELAYSWRYQLPAVASAGFRAIAPDQRGYGGSSRPERILDYRLVELCADLAGLLDALAIERAVFVGHDWGGMVAWGMPVLHPERTLGVAGVCTPYRAIGGLDELRARVGGDDERHYVLWFQPPGVAERVLDAQVRTVFEKLMRRGVPREQAAARMLRDGRLDMNPFRDLARLEPQSELCVGKEELDVYVRAFERTGFRGGINWYRNIERNARDVPELGRRKLTLPCLMITAEWDAALPPELASGMRESCADLEIHPIAGAGHWVQQEKPAELDARLCDWLRRRFASGASE
jgi:pimeloyl-ACP methyl ester carboxylesterase